jgi:hypothetical protein
MEGVQKTQLSEFRAAMGIQHSPLLSDSSFNCIFLSSPAPSLLIARSFVGSAHLVQHLQHEHQHQQRGQENK